MREAFIGQADVSPRPEGEGRDSGGKGKTVKGGNGVARGSQMHWLRMGDLFWLT